MKIEYTKTSVMAFYSFYEQYESQRARLDNNLARSNFTHSVFAVLRRTQEKPKDIKSAWEKAITPSKVTALVLVKNAHIFNETGLEEVAE